MPVVTLPLSFSNSFWTQDYRRGLDVLYGKLQQGVEENSEIINFIKARITAERAISTTLTNPALTGPRGAGFGKDDGASLLMAFRGLQRESMIQGEVAHGAVARDLETIVLNPFEQWAEAHASRIQESREYLLDGAVKSYEQSSAEVAKLKHQYITKTRAADEAEDDAKFAPTSEISEKFTASPTGSIKRTGTVTDRIQQRLREKMAPSKLTGVKEDEEEKDLPSTPRYTAEEKGKMKESPTIQTQASPNRQASIDVPLTPAKASSGQEPIYLAGIAFTPVTVSALLARARAELPMQSVRVPIIGEYDECFTGEDITKWLRENVEAFGGSLDIAEDAARDLGEEIGVWRRVGAIGNKFEPSKEAFYQFRPKAFMLSEETDNESVSSPTLVSSASSLVKRSGTVASYISSALGGNTNDRIQRMRAEADKADHAYATAVRNLDKQRLDLEERIEHGLKVLQSWEVERLRAIKTVLLQYEGTLSTLSSALQASFERSSTLIATYKPEADLTALIERYRTGPFRPTAHVYESVAHVGPGSVSFGIDLGNWAGEGGWNALRAGMEEQRDKPAVPGVLTGLLTGLDEAYKKLATDDERRRTWIYDVPLGNIHQLRDSLNRFLPDDTPPLDLLARFDAPVLAGTVKLWLLEMNPPLGSWEGWEEVRKIYPSVGAGAEQNSADHTEDLTRVLGHLPRVYLQTLDALMSHLKGLIDNTKVEEPDDVYKTKLALSLGRAILRPKYENELSIQDRHPTLFFIDLLNQSSTILPPIISRKQRESGATSRIQPTRKRTALVDQRLSRSSLNGNEDQQKLLHAQMLLRSPRSRNASPSRGDFPSPASPPEDEPFRVNVRTDVVPPTPEKEKPTTAEEPEHDHEVTQDHEEADASTPTIAVERPTPVPSPKPPAPEPPAIETTPAAKGTSDERPESAVPASPAIPPSPAVSALINEDEPITRSASTLTRNRSGELSTARTSRTRGPRATPAGGRSRLVSAEQVASSDVAVAHPHGPVDASEYAPRRKGGRAAAGLFAKRDGRSGLSGDEGEDSS